MENLPQLTECVFVHYSCAVYQNDPKQRIYALGARINGQTEIWYAHQEHGTEISLSNDEIEEASAIKTLYDFLLSHQDKTIIHWNMNEPYFGPKHLVSRYATITGIKLPELSSKWLNLNDYLKDKYGDNYSYNTLLAKDDKRHPRFSNICQLNAIIIYGFHVDGDNYNTIHKMGYKVNTYLSAFEKIHDKDSKGVLVTGGIINDTNQQLAPIGGAKVIERTEKEQGNQDKSQALHIVPDVRIVLRDAIKPYVDEPQHSILTDFIEGKCPQEEIVVHCQQNEFAAAFYKSKAVPRGKAKLFSERLPEFFVRHDGAHIVRLSPSTLEKHLRGLDLPK